VFLKEKRLTTRELGLSGKSGFILWSAFMSNDETVRQVDKNESVAAEKDV